MADNRGESSQIIVIAHLNGTGRFGDYRGHATGHWSRKYAWNVELFRNASTRNAIGWWVQFRDQTYNLIWHE